jgi:hypothetical protein
MVEFYIDIRVVLILVFAHGPSPLLALTGQGIVSYRIYSISLVYNLSPT